MKKEEIKKDTKRQGERERESEWERNNCPYFCLVETQKAKGMERWSEIASERDWEKERTFKTKFVHA